MLFVNDSAVTPGTAVMVPAIGGGYAVRMALHRAEHVEGLEPILLLGPFEHRAAWDLVASLNNRNGGSWEVRGSWLVQLEKWRHVANRKRIKGACAGSAE